MASLYIKDAETAALASELALLLKTTKTDVVRSALREKRASFKPATKPEQSTVEWLREYRAKHPLPQPSGLKADKAFFDEMWGEDPD